MMIFSSVDVAGFGAKHLYSVRREFKRKIIRNLPTGTNDSAARLLKFDNIEHAFERKFVEIKSIRHVVVGRDSLRVGIDHDGAEAFAAECFQRLHARPIELHRAAYGIWARTENGDLILAWSNIVLSTVIG